MVTTPTSFKANESEHTIKIENLPLNEEFNITLVQYQIGPNNVRIKLFRNEIEMFSEVRETKGTFNDVSCFVPGSSEWPPTRNLKFTLRPPIFGKSQRKRYGKKGSPFF